MSTFVPSVGKQTYPNSERRRLTTKRLPWFLPLFVFVFTLTASAKTQIIVMGQRDYPNTWLEQSLVYKLPDYPELRYPPYYILRVRAVLSEHKVSENLYITNITCFVIWTRMEGKKEIYVDSNKFTAAEMVKDWQMADNILEYTLALHKLRR